MRYLALALLLAACSDPEPPSRTQHLKELDVTRIVVRVGSGSVTLRTDDSIYGAVLTAEADFRHETKGDALRIDADSAELEVTVPPRKTLIVTTRSAAVRVEGDWAGGKITSATGNVDVAIGAIPEDFTFTSSGDVAVAVGKKFKGTVQVAGASVEVASHPMLFEKWGTDRKTFTGYVPKGGRLDPASLPRGIWAKSLKGKASFRLLD